MKKNKKARITLEFAIGIVLSILILIAVINIVGGLFRLNNDSRQSFNNLVSLIKDVSDDPAGTVKTTALRMDKETFIVSFAKENESYLYTSKILTSTKEGITLQTNQFNKSDYDSCKENKSCICLCRKFKSKMNEKFIYEIKCEEDSLFCESFDNINFTKSFVISRHSKLTPIKDILSSPQFKEVCVEKYKGVSGEMVAVCENPEDGSCVSEEYKNRDLEGGEVETSPKKNDFETDETEITRPGEEERQRIVGTEEDDEVTGNPRIR